MPELEIVTEVAGRVCTLVASTGGRVGKGDDVVVVEAMKMEIPVASPAAGIILSMLVAVDEMVSEGQTVAILQA
jgi:biotin carboxyl carrier protein